MIHNPVTNCSQCGWLKGISIPSISEFILWLNTPPLSLSKGLRRGTTRYMHLQSKPWACGQ